jgi:hypothetical protein
MDDSHRPWWLVVLLGVCVVGLAVWQSARFKPQVRSGAMLLALIYLAFLAFTIGGDPRGVATWRSWSTQDYLFIGQAVLSVIAAVLLVGRPPPRGQAVWFGLMSIMNAIICAAEKLTGTASLLALLGFACVIYLVKEYWSGRPLRTEDLWPQLFSKPEDKAGAAIWLSGATGLVVSVLLIGTIHYALRAESSRATPTRRLSALPQSARIRSLLNIPAADQHSGLATLTAFGKRPDIVILLSVLAFISFSAAVAKRSTSDGEDSASASLERRIQDGDQPATEQAT